MPDEKMLIGIRKQKYGSGLMSYVNIEQFVYDHFNFYLDTYSEDIVSEINEAVQNDTRLSDFGYIRKKDLIKLMNEEDISKDVLVAFRNTHIENLVSNLHDQIVLHIDHMKSITKEEIEEEIDYLNEIINNSKRKLQKYKGMLNEYKK
jgi:hypothetical protein